VGFWVRKEIQEDGGTDADVGKRVGMREREIVDDGVHIIYVR